MTYTIQITILTSDTDGISAGEITVAGKDQGWEPPWSRLRTGVNR